MIGTCGQELLLAACMSSLASGCMSGLTCGMVVVHCIVGLWISTCITGLTVVSLLPPGAVVTTCMSEELDVCMPGLAVERRVTGCRQGLTLDCGANLTPERVTST